MRVRAWIHRKSKRECKGEGGRTQIQTNTTTVFPNYCHMSYADMMGRALIADAIFCECINSVQILVLLHLFRNLAILEMGETDLLRNFHESSLF